MPKRPFAGIQTASGSPQPVFGTTTTAASVPTYDQFAGNQTGANPSQTTLAVTSTLGFRAGDTILVCPAYPVVGTPNEGRVVSIVSSTSMTVAGLTQSVASGAFVVLAVAAESISIQNISVPALYIGTASTVSSTDPSVVAELTVGGSYTDPTTALSHAYSTVEYWVNGASGSFLANYSQG